MLIVSSILSDGDHLFHNYISIGHSKKKKGPMIASTAVELPPKQLFRGLK